MAISSNREMDGENMVSRPIDLYLDLVKRAVTNVIYQDPQIDPRRVWARAEGDADAAASLLDDSQVWLDYEHRGRAEGRVWPRDAHTMIGSLRLNNLQECVEKVIADQVPGDLVETGVWRGGACIFMRAVLEAHGVRDRKVWVADSFEGLPEPDRDRFPADGKRFVDVEPLNKRVLRVSLEDVQENFRRYGLLDDQVAFLKGYFKDTLPTAPIDRIAVLRLDGDMYQSTMDTLVHLYPKVSPGGHVIVDDYNALEECAMAVTDYRKENGITEPIVSVDWSEVYWTKSA